MTHQLKRLDIYFQFLQNNILISFISAYGDVYVGTGSESKISTEILTAVNAAASWSLGSPGGNITAEIVDAHETHYCCVALPTTVSTVARASETFGNGSKSPHMSIATVSSNSNAVSKVIETAAKSLNRARP